MASYDETQAHNQYAPLDFSNILGYPNETYKHGWSKSIPIFHEYKDRVAEHIMMFKEFLVAWDTVDEDLIMKRFIISLDLQNNKDVGDWYDELPPNGIPSFLQLVKAFEKEWDPNLDKEKMEAMISIPKKEHVQDILED